MDINFQSLINLEEKNYTILNDNLFHGAEGHGVVNGKIQKN